MQYISNLSPGIRIDGLDLPREESVQRLLNLIVGELCEDRYRPAIHYICIDSYKGTKASLNQDRYYAHVHQSMLEYDEIKWKERPHNYNDFEFICTDYFVLIKHVDQYNVATYEVHKISDEAVSVIRIIESGLKDNYLTVLNGIINGSINTAEGG